MDLTAQRLSCHESSLPHLNTGFQHWHCGGICSPRGSRELGFVPQMPTSTDVFICRGKQLQFKNVIAVSMLSARTAVHSDECQLLTENQSLAFSSSDLQKLHFVGVQEDSLMPLVKRCLSGLLISVTALARSWGPSDKLHLPFSVRLLVYSIFSGLTSHWT